MFCLASVKMLDNLSLNIFLCCKTQKTKMTLEIKIGIPLISLQLVGDYEWKEKKRKHGNLLQKILNHDYYNQPSAFPFLICSVLKFSFEIVFDQMVDL